jgi:SAM-dependent methyltransferase
MNDNLKTKNIDISVVEDFGKEWQAFNQRDIKNEDLLSTFNQYFHIFPLDQLHSESIGFDMGCGSGRWSKFIAPKVKQLNCIDPSPLALEQAKNIQPVHQSFIRYATGHKTPDCAHI